MQGIPLNRLFTSKYSYFGVVCFPGSEKAPFPPYDAPYGTYELL